MNSVNKNWNASFLLDFTTNESPSEWPKILSLFCPSEMVKNCAQAWWNLTGKGCPNNPKMSYISRAFLLLSRLWKGY